MPSASPPIAAGSVELAGILDVLPEPAIALGTDYRILAANHAYREAFGAGRPIEGRRCHEVSHGYGVPCDRAGQACPLREACDSGVPQRALHVHHGAAAESHVDLHMHPVRDAQGAIAFLVESLRETRLASTSPTGQGLVGRSPAFNRMIELMQRVAPSEVAVLLLGESGTGKELVARALHQSSPRAGGPFVPVECSGLTESLFESELFGHEKGAFTGAHYRKTGLVEGAHGGTLFLDEVGDIPLPLQIKLLRLLETGSYRRAGSTEAQQADFRLICATHRPLRDMVRAGGFREDLYYRLAVFPIPLPALRERGEDLELLAATLLQRIAPHRRLELHAAALQCLRAYAFPGNVRELRNLLERAALLADERHILPVHLPEECRCAGPVIGEREATGGEVVPLRVMEQRYLREVAARFRGDRRALAKRLGLSERTLYRKLKGEG